MTHKSEEATFGGDELKGLLPSLLVENIKWRLKVIENHFELNIWNPLFLEQLTDRFTFVFSLCPPQRVGCFDLSVFIYLHAYY